MTINDLPKRLQVEGVQIYNGEDITIRLTERQTIAALIIHADDIPEKEPA